MQGPAHDELHKWLVPLTDNVKKLSTVKGEEVQNQYTPLTHPSMTLINISNK